jgi:mutator protein MutT
MTPPAHAITKAVSLIMLKGDNVLMVQRGNAPYQGYWSFPGGVIESGETCEQAVVRELFEETGLSVAAPHLVGEIRFERGGKLSMILYVHTALWQDGEPIAGDDADAATFFPFSGISELNTTPQAELWLERARAHLA